MPHNELGVHQNVAAKDQSCNDAIAELDAAAAWEEGSHEAEKDQDPQRSKQVGHPAGKVIFALAGENGEEDEDAKSED